MNYITTKEQCQKRIDETQNVCTCCGGELVPLKTVDNSNRPTYWIGCEKCQKFDNGTKEKIFKIAVKMVDERRFRAYNYEQEPCKEKDPAIFEYWRGGQISGTVGIVTDILRFEKQM